MPTFLDNPNPYPVDGPVRRPSVSRNRKLSDRSEEGQERSQSALILLCSEPITFSCEALRYRLFFSTYDLGLGSSRQVMQTLTHTLLMGLCGGRE